MPDRQTIADVEATRALEWLGSRRDLELSFESDWPAEGDAGAWQVYRVGGGRSDREWDLVGSGDSPLKAILDARQTLQGDADA